MADELIRSGPFTSVNGDRGYKNSFFTDYFASFIGNGVFPNPSTNLQVLEGGGLTLTVRKGRAWVNGQIHLGDEDANLTLDPGDNLLPRIDKVVLRVDYINRTITKEVKKGTPATNPVAPNLQRDNDIYELGLASIRVNVGVTNITQSNIIDLRLNSNECGIVHGIISQVDPTAIFNQFQSWYEQTKSDYDTDVATWTDEKKQAFLVWVDTTQSAWDDLLDARQAQVGVEVFTSITEPTEAVTGDIWLREVN